MVKALSALFSKLEIDAAILDHLPAPIEDIYFYFSPDRLTTLAAPEPLPYNKELGDFSGYLMVYGECPPFQPFMIQPISRC